MPEGFNSVADLVVAIKADTKEFHGGLSSVMDAMKSFDGFTGGSLKGLIEFGEKGKLSVGGILGTLTEVGGRIAKVGEVLNLAGEVAGRVAEAAGAGDEFAKIEGEAAGVQQVLTALAQQGLAEVQDEAKQAAAALGLYASSAGAAEESSENFVQRGLARMSEAIRNVKLDLASLATPGTLDIDTEGQLLDRTNAQIAELKRRLSEADAAAGASGGSDPGGAAATQLAALEKQAWILSQFQAMERVPWTATIDTGKQDEYLKRLADEVALLEKKASLIGASAAVSAASLASERFRLDAARSGVGFGPDQERQADDLFGRMQSAQSRLDAAAEAKRAGELAERQDKGADRTIDSLVRSIEAERNRRREIGLSAGQIAALRAEEAALAAIRANGREATDAERIAIKASAMEKGREVEATEKLLEAQRRLRASAAVLERSLESAFTGWMRGAKTDWGDLVGSMLADMAILSLRQNVLAPLFGGGGTGSGLVGDVIGSIFGGFRADGGPVEAGKAYIVGERRPELFIPNTSGRIEPSIGGGGQAVQIVTNIDARGASVDAVQELKAAMAARDAALPNQVLAVVREGRERGVA
jgi:hypothetical protein